MMIWKISVRCVFGRDLILWLRKWDFVDEKMSVKIQIVVGVGQSNVKFKFSNDATTCLKYKNLIQENSKTI